MEFHVVFEKYLDMLMEPSVMEPSVTLFPVFLVICCLTLNKILLLLSAGKSIILLLSPKDGLPL